MTQSLQTKILRRGLNPEEYRIYRAALEWDLTDPIVIEKKEDLKSGRFWDGRLEPFNHQVSNLMTFCRRLPVTLLADDVGLGKTISAGLIISELIARSRLSKILIVCPKILGAQWQEELQSKFGLPSEIAVGKDLLHADPEGNGAVITTYNSARLYLDDIPDDRYQMLILDEAHKLRNLYGTEKAPQVAVRFRKALAKRKFPFVLMLTATPIQNRLWDLYSLVDLLTVARGHENPFGTEGEFARKFIADSKEQARQLKSHNQDEFRSIVYGYMSRVRRGDAKLYFPERVVQMHRVRPTQAELDIISTIAKPLQKMNRLAQISILQALTSSPDALMAQLNNMARNETVPIELAKAVEGIVSRMPTSAKLNGLAELIAKLKSENADKWRLVVFTGRRETQTTIQTFLEKAGLKVGIINGGSGPRNQETIKSFKADPPECHVIVSTEAGSEGINLQVANVLVNFDLPWNPMIVEQRIGRIQRLASNHANVAIFNITLQGTFEECIVGRLMEKLQMASHAIGDVEALLEGSGLDGDDDDDSTFEEKIRQLVMAALENKDFDAALRQTEQSIQNAKENFEKEKSNIETMLGGMDASPVGPRAPKLPESKRSMSYQDFVLGGYKSLGGKVEQLAEGSFSINDKSQTDYIHFDERHRPNKTSNLHSPGTPSFIRLVNQLTQTGVHEVDSANFDVDTACEQQAKQWSASFGAVLVSSKIKTIRRRFEGAALLRVRATVAHDSYERLIEVACDPERHFVECPKKEHLTLPHVIEDSKSIGISPGLIHAAAENDLGIAEFCRFYVERRVQEVASAGPDERRRRKLEEEFTPRIVTTVVGLSGKVYHDVTLDVEYRFDSRQTYNSLLEIGAERNSFLALPPFGRCSKLGRELPQDCLGKCEVSKVSVLREFLKKSEISARVALAEHFIICGHSGKTILKDEAESSAISGKLIASQYLKSSEMSGLRAEPEYFEECDFTKADVLSKELALSEISKKRYRTDQQAQSELSGRKGHQSEFIRCSETSQLIAESEAEKCAVTGEFFRPGILVACHVTHMKVQPTELELCSHTNKLVLKRLLVTSNISNAKLLEEAAMRSSVGKFCSPEETKECAWSGIRCHPDDLFVCASTGLAINTKFGTDEKTRRLKQLAELTTGSSMNAEGTHIWPVANEKIAAVVRNNNCRILSAITSPNGKRLALCAETRALFGLHVRRFGAIFDIEASILVGRVS